MRRVCGGEPTIFLFSDEPDYLDRAFAGVPNAVVVRSDPARSWEDMFLMSRCRHHVIANSSYSWWGAWLNPNLDKIVIAPAMWFARATLAKTCVVDLFPEGWILLK